MTNDGGGWTLGVVIKGDSIFHAGQSGAVGNVTQLVEDAKLSDAMITLITRPNGFWRFECGQANVFVRTTSGTWTSAKTNAQAWSLDRGRDGVFECGASRVGYTFSDLACGAVGHVSHTAAGGVVEGTGCFHSGEGWSQAGKLWIR